MSVPSASVANAVIPTAVPAIASSATVLAAALLSVTGPTANKLSVLNGGWTITWQGDREDLYPQEKFTILEAIKTKIVLLCKLCQLGQVTLFTNSL